MAYVAATGNLLYEYNALDAVMTEHIWNAISHYKEDKLWSPSYDMTIRLYEPLLYIMTRGLKIDFDALEIVKKEVEEKLLILQADLDERVGYSLNCASPKACMDFFYNVKNIPPYVKDGKPTIDDKALQRIARGTATRPGLREASLVQEIRGLRKMLGTYLEIRFDDDNRFRCSYNPRGTNTGRLSSSKTIFGTGMNFQNLPPAFRKFIVADEGMTMIEPDKARAEWVVVAYASGDARMIDIIERNADPHASTASLMFGLPLDAILEEDHVVGHTTDPVEIAQKRESLPWLRDIPFITRNMSMRQAGKKANHGLNYGEGFKLFALINEMLESEAKRVIFAYENAYPAILTWRGYIESKIRKDRMLENCYGRVKKYYGMVGPDLYRQAYAFIPQSTVSDMLNMGICDIYESEDPILRPVDLLAQVHDSILFQYPTDLLQIHKQELFMKIDKALSTPAMYGGREFLIATDFKSGSSWGDLKGDSWHRGN